MDAADALARRGVQPYEPGLKEGIALVNGAPLAPALAAWLAAALPRAARSRDARRRADRGAGGRLAAAVLARASAGSRAIPGQERVHAQLARAARRGRRLGRPAPGPVSFRVLPQVHGAAARRGRADRRSRSRASCARSPTARSTSAPSGDEPEGFYPSGNFHAQALSFELDALAIAFAQVGNLSEKRLHRLLDSRFSGLADQLAAEPGPPDRARLRAQVGARVRRREPAARRPRERARNSTARPGRRTSRRTIFLAAEQLGRLLDNLELILAAELVAIRQARHLRAAPLPPALQARRAARGRSRRAGGRGPVAERRLRARARPDPVGDAPRRRRGVRVKTRSRRMLL